MKQQKSKKFLRGLSVAFICSALMLTACNNSSDNWLTNDPDSSDKDPVSDYSKLTAPTGLTYDSRTSTIQWNIVYGASGYVINIDGKEIESRVTQTSYRYDDFEEGKAYLISVKALGTEGGYDDSSYSSIYYNKEAAVSNFAYSYYGTNTADQITIEVTGFSSSADEENLEDIEIPSEIDGFTVVRIADQAFRSASSLRSVILPSTIESIGIEAFYNSDLEEITLNDGLKSIETSAFEGSRIETIAFPQSLTTLGSRAFYDSRLESVTFHANMSLSTIPELCFSETYLETVVLPPSVTTIETEAFSRIDDLTSIEFNYEGRKSNVTTIGDSAFLDAISLRSLVLPASLKELGEGAFRITSGKSSSLETLMFEPDSQLQKVGASAFSRILNGDAFTYFGPQIDSVTETDQQVIRLPKCIQEIGANAFEFTNATTLTFEEGSQLQIIGASAFSQNTSLTTVTFPESLQRIKASAFNSCSQVENITFHNTNNQLVEIDSTAFSSTPWYRNQNKIIVNNILIKDETATGTELVVDNGIRYIANNVYENKNFTSITLPSSLVGIYDSAFASNTQITSISIPSNVTYIGKNAFSGCSNVHTLQFATNSQLQTIDEGAFSRLDQRTDTTSLKLESIQLPDSVVTIGANAFSYNINLSTFTITNNSQLETIGDSAFSMLYSLKTIHIPSSVISIGNSAFATLTGRNGLTSVTFGANAKLESIGNNAFEGNDQLVQMTLPASLKSIGNYAFADTTNLSEFSIEANSQLESIGERAFYSSGITSIHLPATMKYLGNNAFESARNLTNATFDANAFSQAEQENQVIYSNTFSNCASLVQMHLPEFIHTIQENAFNNCTNLRTITTSATVIHPRAFNNTAFVSSFEDGMVILNHVLIVYNGNATDVTIPEGVTHINQEAFQGRRIVNISLPSTLVSIGDNAFSNCTALQNVTIPSSSVLESIGTSAFYNCSALLSIRFPTSLKEIGTFAFTNCQSLTHVNLANTQLETIPFAAFANCRQLQTVYLPQTLTSIDVGAFYFDQLTSIDIPNQVTSIGDYAFAFNMASNPNNLTITNDQTTALSQIETHLTSILSNAGRYSYSLEQISIGSSNSQLQSIGRYGFAGSSITDLVLPKETDLHLSEYAFSYALLLESATFEFNVSFDLGVLYGANSLKEIEHNSNILTFTAFGNNINSIPASLEKIIISDGSTIILDHAFDGYSFVKSIELPDTITTIGNGAFYGCRNLSTINLKNVETIGDEAFYGCTNLEIDAASLTALTNAGNKAFAATKWLNQSEDDFIIVNGILILYKGEDAVVTLPDSVTTIAGGAFSGNATVTQIIGSENLTKINRGAFDSATSLESLVLNSSTVVEIDLNVFDSLSDDFKVQVTDKELYISSSILWSLYQDVLA